MVTSDCGYQNVLWYATQQAKSLKSNGLKFNPLSHRSVVFPADLDSGNGAV